MAKQAGGHVSVAKLRFLILGSILAVLVISGCSNSSDLALDGAPEDTGSNFIEGVSSGDDDEGEDTVEQVSGTPQALSNVEPDEDVPTTTETTTTAAPTTTTTTTTIAPTTTAETTTTDTTIAETPTTETTTPRATSTSNNTDAGVANPAGVPGAVASRVEGLGVITEPGDPLNVRTGPGVANDIVAELAHQSTGITSTHIVDVGTREWRFVERNGEPLGWVSGRFLQKDVSISFCKAPAAMPTGLVGESAVQVSIDEDGVPDRVAIFTEELGGGNVRLWVRADLSDGGVVAGSSRVLRDVPATPNLRVQFMTNTLASGFNEQFLVQIGGSASASEWTVFALVGCNIELTTLDGSPFTFSEGERNGRSFSRGCIYGGGENRFVTLEDGPSSRTISQFALSGSQWSFPSQEIIGVDPDTGEFPEPDRLVPCLES